jgi:hypothetical protein
VNDAQTVVVTSVAVSGAVVLANDAVRGQVPTIRFGVGLGVSALGLAVMAQFAPRLAQAFAVLLLTTTVFVYGGPALSAVTTATT